MKNRLFARAFGSWLVIVCFLVACTASPNTPVSSISKHPKNPAVPSRNSQSGFKTKAANDNLCLKQNWFDNGLTDTVYIKVDLKTPRGEWINWSPKMGNGKFRIIPQEDGNYLLTQLDDHAYSGPYGYHLHLFPQPVVIPGPITPGKTITVPFAPNATGSYYRFGDSSAYLFDISGSINLTFGLDKITAAFNSTSGVLTESAYFTEGYVRSITGEVTFGPTQWEQCPGGVELTVDPEAISPVNEGDEFDTATFHVVSNTGEDWTLSVDGNKKGPVDDRGLPTKGEACTWSTIGTEAEKDVEWNGKCNGGEDMVDGQYTATLTSNDLEATAPIMIDNTAPLISKPTYRTTPAGRYEIIYYIEEPTVNGASSILDPNIANEGEHYPGIIGLDIEIINSKMAKATFTADFSPDNSDLSFSTMLERMDSNQGFSTKATTSRSQIVVQDSLKNARDANPCHPGPDVPKTVKPYNPMSDPSFQACSNGNIQLLTVLDNDKTGPDLTLIIGVRKNLAHLEVKGGKSVKPLDSFQKSNLYKNLFTPKFDTNNVHAYISLNITHSMSHPVTA